MAIHTEHPDSDRKHDEQITVVSSAATNDQHQHQHQHHGDELRSLWQNIKKYRKIVWITFGLTSAILLYGYDNVVVGTVSGMPRFQQDFGVQLKSGKWILPSKWLALWNVAAPLGAMVGAIFGGWFQDKVGRRTALATSSLFSAVAVAVMYVSYLPEHIDGRRGCFFAGKFLQGAAIGAVMAATQTYMSEILPPVLRGSGMAFFPVFTLLGQLTGALVIYGSLNKSKGYAVAFGSQWPFSFVPIVVSFFIPESPTYYVRKRQMDKALKAQARLDPIGTDTKSIVAKIEADVKKERLTSRSTYIDCFRRENLRRTLIVVWANSLTALFGVQLLGKASYFLQIVGMKANTSIIFLILGIVLGLIANVVSVWVTSRVGRRPLIIWSLSISSLFWLSMGIANCFHGGAVIWWTAVSMMLTIIVCGVSVWPASFAVGAETSSLQLRAKTQGIGWLVSAFTAAVAGIVLPYVFNPDAGDLRGKVGFTYVGSCILGAIVTFYVIPEMKDRSAAEIDRMFELNLPARAFQRYDLKRDDGGKGNEVGV